MTNKAFQSPSGNVQIAIVQFIVDAQWSIVSEAAAPHACLEQRALRASWLRALESIGMTEDQAREAGRGLWMRAPK